MFNELENRSVKGMKTKQSCNQNEKTKESCNSQVGKLKSQKTNPYFKSLKCPHRGHTCPLPYPFKKYKKVLGMPCGHV